MLWRLPKNVGYHRISESEEQSGRSGFWSKLARVDFLGAVTLPTMLVALFVTLDFAGKSYPWYYVAPPGAAAIVLSAAFYYVEKYRAKEPILPLELLARRDVYTTYSIVALQTGAQFIVSRVQIDPGQSLDTKSQKLTRM